MGGYVKASEVTVESMCNLLRKHPLFYARLLRTEERLFFSDVRQVLPKEISGLGGSLL